MSLQGFYCPNRVLGEGTICENGYPVLKEFPQLGENPKLEFKTPTIRCRAWKEKCNECHDDCHNYNPEDLGDCLGKTGYCLIIDPVEVNYEW